MIYDTDSIELYTVTQDDYGAITKSAAEEYTCVIENTNELIYNAEGTKEKANFLILIDTSFAGVLGDIIKIKTQFGTISIDNKEYKIKKIFETGGMSSSHKQVYI